MARKRIQTAVDVFDNEPMRETDSNLAAHPNVVSMPHIGYDTEDGFDLQFSDILEQINAHAADAAIDMINPDAWR